MARKHKRNMQMSLKNEMDTMVDEEIIEQIIPEPIVVKESISQYNDKDFVVVNHNGQIFPVKYARAKAMGYKVIRKHE